MNQNSDHKPPTPFIKGARKMRNNPTKAEREMWYKILRHQQMQGLTFLRQKPLDQFIVDFYCSSLQLAIEIDGDSHLESEIKDFERSTILENKYDLQIIRYTNNEV